MIEDENLQAETDALLAEDFEDSGQDSTDTSPSVDPVRTYSVPVSTQSNVVPGQTEPTGEDVPEDGPELTAYIAARRPEYVEPPTTQEQEQSYLREALGISSLEERIAKLEGTPDAAPPSI